MIHSLSVRFYPNELKAKGGRIPIYIRITLNRKKSEIATFYSVESKDWDDTKQRTKKNAKINDFLASMESRIYEIATRLDKEKKSVNAHIIKRILTNKDILDTSLVDFYDKFIQDKARAGEVVKETVLRYQYTLNYLKQFIVESRLGVILFENINFKFLNEFDLFLIQQKVDYGRSTMGRNTVNKHHSCLRTVLIRAVKEGYILKNPYVDFKLRNTPSNRSFLNNEELNQLATHDLGGNQSLQKVRDIFIFSVYTGLRFEDAQQLTMDRIIMENGNITLQIKQAKTGEALLIPVFAPAMDIIKKYEHSGERKILNRVLPKITNQKLNSYLKIIADITGINKTLTHHVARHTCATTILLSNDAPIEAVSRWLGHTSIKTTQIYAKITNRYLQQVADGIKSKI